MSMLSSNKMLLSTLVRGVRFTKSAKVVTKTIPIRCLSTSIIKPQQFDQNDDFQARLRSMTFKSDLGSNLKEQKWDDLELTEVNTGFYEPADSVRDRPEEEVEQFRRDSAITVKMSGGSGSVPKPVLDFQESGFCPEILRMLQTEGGFEKPMPIQAQGWPVAMSGLDLVGIGQTGSGKTLGYLLPAFEHIRNQQEQQKDKFVTGSPIALTLAPTRELAQQINQVAKKYGRRIGIKTACLFGGSSKGHQIRDLDACPEFVVATPGRLIDLLEAGYVELKRCTYVVLDEADRMLDMGFEPQMRSVLSQVRPDRQMLMWSATWPEEVRDLARDFFRRSEYVHLNIGSTELSANHNIHQIVKIVDRRDKNQEIVQFIQRFYEEEADSKRDKILVFAETKRQVDFLEKLLFRRGFRATSIHGDKTQRMRDQAILDFKNSRFPILVATNVAARGLDVDDVKCVVNYDFPNDSEDYIHRIGRTGRRNNAGTSFTLFTEEDARNAKDLIKVLKEANQDVDPELEELAWRARGSGQKKKNFRAPGGGFRVAAGAPRAGLRRDSHEFRRSRYDDDDYVDRTHRAPVMGRRNSFDDLAPNRQRRYVDDGDLVPNRRSRSYDDYDDDYEPRR